jgi:DNA-binding MarR family transcriptional regulator
MQANHLYPDDTQPMATSKKSSENKAQKPAAKPFRFGFLIHDVSRMRRTLFDFRMKPLGITRSQWSVLAALSRGGNDGVMQIELAREMDVGKVTIGGLIMRLEKIGYVRREDDAYDGRARRVFITEKGYDIIQQMEALGAANNEILLAGIDPEVLKITEDALAKVKANIRRELDKVGSEQTEKSAGAKRAKRAPKA